MKTSVDAFAGVFGPHLAASRRWQAFMYIVGKLLGLQREIHLLETGCLRRLGNWEGDGQSTLVWNWFVETVGGSATSVDLNLEACSLAQQVCPLVEVHHGDSLQFLSSNRMLLTKLDLVFLDSMDYFPPHAHSELHHAAELALAYHHLKPGCLIAVDDCLGTEVGKHVFVKLFFDRLGQPPVFEGYITVWEKRS